MKYILLTIPLFCGSCTEDNADDVKTIEHDYHKFVIYDGKSYAGGIIHHPGCGCLKGEKEGAL